MVAFKHILVASNLSPTARRSYRHAAAFARAFDAKVTLLHVNELDGGLRDQSGLSEYLQTISQLRDERIQQARADFQGYGVDIDVAIVEGSPKQAIYDYTCEHDVDMVVMAKTNRAALTEFFLGSTTKRVLRLVRVPILVIHEGGDLAGPLPERLPTYDHVLTPTDFSDLSHRGLKASAELTEALGGSLTVMHVVRVPPTPLAAGEISIGLPRGGVGELQQSHGARLKRELREAGAEDARPLLIVGGSPGDSIVKTAKDEGVGLIAIPTAGKGFIRGLLLGSTAERVAEDSPIPVLVMPRTFLSQWAPPEEGEDDEP